MARSGTPPGRATCATSSASWGRIPGEHATHDARSASRPVRRAHERLAYSRGRRRALLDPARALDLETARAQSGPRVAAKLARLDRGPAAVSGREIRAHRRIRFARRAGLGLGAVPDGSLDRG